MKKYNEDLSKILSENSEKWVALSQDTSKVVGSGKTIKDAVAEAGKKGENNPVITRVPKDYGNYILVTEPNEISIY